MFKVCYIRIPRVQGITAFAFIFLKLLLMAPTSLSNGAAYRLPLSTNLGLLKVVLALIKYTGRKGVSHGLL